MKVLSSRNRPEEKERIADLLKIVPKQRQTILDIGARDGYITELLTKYFKSVTALDLIKPTFTIPNVEVVKGDVTCLDYPYNEFDVVFCAEVLEHIPQHLLTVACDEITRVARHEVVIGVPFNQDTRAGKTTCHHCGCVNPPWGHINSFTEAKLKGLFSSLECITTSYSGNGTEKTNAISAQLMNIAGNPWGTYEQEEPCIQCGEKLLVPDANSVLQRVCSKTAVLLNKVQLCFVHPSPLWVHMVFRKKA